MNGGAIFRKACITWRPIISSIKTYEIITCILIHVHQAVGYLDLFGILLMKAILLCSMWSCTLTAKCSVMLQKGFIFLK